MKKKIKYCLLGIMAFSCFSTKINASAYWDVSSGFADTGTKPIPITPKEPIPLGEITEGNTKKEYSCTYEYNSSSNPRYDVSIYKKEDEEILNSDFTIDKNKLPLAGTAVGVNIKETKNISWEVTKVTLTVNTYESTITNKYRCEYKKKDDNQNDTFIPWMSITSVPKIQQIADALCSVNDYDVEGDTTCIRTPKKFSKLCEYSDKVLIGYVYSETKDDYNITLDNTTNNNNDKKKFDEWAFEE